MKINLQIDNVMLTGKTVCCCFSSFYSLVCFIFGHHEYETLTKTSHYSVKFLVTKSLNHSKCITSTFRDAVKVKICCTSPTEQRL